MIATYNEKLLMTLTILQCSLQRVVILGKASRLSSELEMNYKYSFIKQLKTAEQLYFPVVLLIMLKKKSPLAMNKPFKAGFH